ncbi:carbohydrate ABC transporter permease [Paenibacillus rhizovicinus]|uniref:Carbohydrate ABC transporter permease n=1 Tax=Paenibacillus rhizovicinus TaxID=2704463 RepID=A0A6C0P657_9BACL|nr:carbohydrate ABC transporter permease [Paenibacillus rhizovicinus]QHW33999.1 carbohydrate ABC transporter permease [Paenibacillus rhizovicinus]
MKKPQFSFMSLAIGLVLLLLAASMIYPFLYMLAVSLSGDKYVIKGAVTLIPKGLNTKVYRIVLDDPRIFTAYRNTILYVFVGTAISLAATSLGAYALSKKNMLFHTAFTYLIVFTMFFGGGMIPTFLVVRGLGLVDSIWGMVLPTAISTWNLIIMRTFFAGFPSELEESGKIDGLNDFQVFYYLVMPVTKAIFATIGLFYAVGIWNNFYSALLYLRSQEHFPLQVVLRNIILAGQVRSSNVTSVGGDQLVVEESLKYAVIMVSTLPILLVYPFLQKYFVKGAMIGSVKG